MPHDGPPPPDCDVLVVGAGPTGATAAGLLARRGLRVLVVEKRPGVHPLPRAVHFDDEVLRVFTGMGLGDDVRAVSTPVPGMRLVTGDGGVLVELPRDTTGGRDGLPGANMFHQPDLEAVLRADLARQPLVELRESAEVRGVRQTGPDRVQVELADGTLLTASAVLGCDGAGSPVRHAVGIGMVQLGRPSTWLVADVRTTGELDVWPGVHQVCDPVRAATSMRVGERRYRLEFALRPGETEAGLTAALPGLLPPWLTGAGVDWEVERCTAYTYRARVAARWRSGRVLLLGDAAHQTPPFLGQGMCAGIRDAANLEWKLALVLRGAAPDTLLDSYETERRPHATSVVRTAIGLGAVMTARGRLRSAGRSALLRGIARVPGLPARITRHGWPPLHRGPLVQRRPGPGTTVGRPCPTPLVRTATGERRLDDVLGTGLALLTRGGRPAPAGVRVVRVVDRDPRDDDEVHDPTGGLDRWLRAGDALVRPDRVVLARRRGAADWAGVLATAGLHDPGRLHS